MKCFINRNRECRDVDCAAYNYEFDDCEILQLSSIMTKTIEDIAKNLKEIKQGLADIETELQLLRKRDL